MVPKVLLFPGSALLGGVIFAAPMLAVAPAHADDAEATVAVPPVVVTGQRTEADGSAADGYRSSSATLGPLGKAPLQDTPYSINVTPGALIERQAAHTLADALKTNPTVAPLLNANSAFTMSRVMVRGFTAADQNELRDGLVDRSFTLPPMEIVDRIEVLNGMSGFLYGFSAPGGLINYISKRPTEQTLLDLSSGVYNGSVAYVHGDAGGRVPGTDGRLGYRFNAYQEAGSTVIDGSQQRRSLVSLSLSYEVRPNTTVWFDVWHQDMQTNGLPTTFDAPNGNWSGTGTAVPSASAFRANRQYGQDWTFNKSSKTLAGVGLDSKLNDIFTLRAAMRYGYMWRKYAYVDAILQGNTGNYLERANFDSQQTERTESAYALMDAAFDTGPLRHEATFGYTHTRFFYERAPEVQSILGLSNIDNPVSFAQPSVSFAPNNNFQRVTWDNFVVADRVSVGPYVSLLLGATAATLQQNAWGSGSAISTSNYRAQQVTPSVGITVKPIPELSLYASYIQGLQAGDSTTSSAAVNRNQVLAPSVSNQYEVGAKTTIGRLGINLALFRIDKVNAEIDPADSVYKQDGREIHQGIELVTTGRVNDSLAVVGGFTLMDAFISKASAVPASEGKTPINVPEQQARLYLEYTVPGLPDLTLSGGMNYYGKRPLDTLNTAYLPAATTFDAGLRYSPEIAGHRVSATLNAFNLFDRSYWMYYRSGDGLLLGAGRTITFTLKASL
ncbi:Ferrichrome-iron receptor [Rhodovastum atsumiense]|uniref:TonB-dependent receptor n=1 Tax=Rhodovastum atsumiense TaxID=504468 RepID=A0A5M6J0D6_9PROT|nr:TonB-dependent receptor [Rhodovastum atsumiense]KAA5614066.1 TonB-dependent receptor [Rhodovastum atsumiense]CAH2598883.1 Ferrichrome-iron receptor [Rhodovastum atsumiense]